MPFNTGETTRFRRCHHIVPTQTTNTLMLQLTVGLSHMHKLSVLHRDIKPPNLLLHSSGRAPLQLLICDFGWCCQGTAMRNTLAQTPGYRAPEVALGASYGMGADVWSVGVIFRELLTGICLWQTFQDGRDELQQIQRLGAH